MNELILGDCLEQMKLRKTNTVDAIVTDPPYGLAFMGAKWDSFGGKSCGNDSMEVRRQKSEEYAKKNKGAPRYGNSHAIITTSAMVAFQSAMTPIFAEALRIAKPGAYLLAFGGTRTYHRLACAIEDAGWEVRDCIMWVYGSGFPKSMDVAKAIDKASGYEGEVVGTRIVDVGMQGGNMHAGRKQQQQQQIHALSPEAAAWNGWGTCLKPAVEPIIVARKPLEGTVAANVLKYGTGAINIDRCRVPTEDNLFTHGGKITNKVFGEFPAIPSNQTDGQKLGRFPANLIHDGSDEVLALFPDSKGQCGAVKGTEPSHTGTNGIYGNYNRQHSMPPRGDSGSAARFFYCAKASRSERGEGNIHPTVKPIALMKYLCKLVAPKGAAILDPFMGSGTTGVACVELGYNFIGIEREEAFYNIAKNRIKQSSAKNKFIQCELNLGDGE